jgi:RNA polymerase sigma-70 factor (ECF subfamily)
MMRITQIPADGQVARYQIEGRITAQAMASFSDSLAGSARGQRRLILDLSGVKFVDEAGARVLRDLESNGTVLTGCSPFVRELLRAREDREASAGGADNRQHAEGDLIERLRRGEDEAYEAVVRAHSGRMLATARRFLSREEDARDAVQDAFLSAFKNLGSFTGNARLSTWLHRIVVNAALMKLRSRRRKPEESIADLLPRFDEDGEWVADSAQWAAPSDELLTRQETRQLVRRCIDRLPESYRTVLLLRDIEELDTDEVATLLDVTPNAVKVRLHRARQALRALVMKELIEEEPRASTPNAAATP